MRFYDNLLGHNLSDPNLNLNLHGHRCRNISDINMHNYILFAGDNVAVDFNQPLEKTYPYLISNSLKMDYYNVAVFNGGLETIKYNLLTWYHTYPKPKFIVVSAEFLDSLLVSDSKINDIAVADYNNKAITQIMSVGETSGFFPSRRVFAENVLLNTLAVPIYQIKFENKNPLFTSVVNTVNLTGDIFNHEKIAELVVSAYQSTKRKMVP